ncbi:MAG: hypothetical protein JST92_05590 [Deltaproteobacteria bacterium]|nr:hypothetical protein [Deltaproteobacteria bacterium]
MPSRRLAAFASLALLALPALASKDLAAAQAWFKKGRDVDVLTTIRDEARIPPAERPQAARLLTASFERSVQKQRFELAQQLAEASFDLDPAQPSVLRFLINGALDDQHFAQARRYLEIWHGLRPQDAADTDAMKAKINDAESSKTSLFGKAKAFFKPKDKAKGSAIILYGTSWCPACKKAREYLKRKGIAFIEKDVEADPMANLEKKEKARAAGLATQSVPVLDANGTTLLGFSEAQYEQAIARGGE